MNLGLENRVCVVTGATRGIGAATARMLAQEGARVLSVARNAVAATGQAPAAPAGGASPPLLLDLDVTDPDAGERVLDACPAPPWALVSAAGWSGTRTLDELSDADWQEHWDLHVMGPMRLMRALAPAMAEAGGGRIVTVSSSSGKRPSGRLDPAYSVTKAAQLSLSRVFADRWAARGVLVNAVTPGPIAGESWTGEGGLAEQLAARSGKTRDEVLEATGSGQPLGRMGSDDEVAAVIAFLCSALASNVVGAAWSVDGGSVPTIL